MFIGRIVKHSFLASTVFLVAVSAFGQADPDMLKDI
jgi:hypothetical protein